MMLITLMNQTQRLLSALKNPKSEAAQPLVPQSHYNLTVLFLMLFMSLILIFERVLETDTMT